MVQTDRLGELAGVPWVLSIDVQQPLAEPTNSTGRILGRAEVLALPAVLGGRGLRGEGVRIGIWDSNIASHIDYGNRVHVQEYEESGDHGPHVLGTVLGAGMLDPDGKGMAPMAEAWSYNFNVQSNGLTSPEEMDIARRNFGISLSQNSYGVGLRLQCAKIKTFPYRASDINLDILSNLYPTLTHVFAAGNDQEGCAAETTEIWGKAGYGTISNHAKNVIHVGAVTATGRGTAFSSQGPHDDGRLAPTICAKGQEVYSVMPGNGYQTMSGTSMACPMVSGTAALLAERYAQLNQGREIRSDLLRSILANTATDIGRPGPDFQYGYGIMDAEKAAITLENGYYHYDSLATAQLNEWEIPIPSACQGLRVMIAWIDPPAYKTPQWGSRVLINDLDLSLEVGGTTYLPWVCNGTKGHVEDNAARAVDTLNNMEQITLNQSELRGKQGVKVLVKGARCPRASSATCLPGGMTRVHCGWCRQQAEWL